MAKRRGKKVGKAVPYKKAVARANKRSARKAVRGLAGQGSRPSDYDVSLAAKPYARATQGARPSDKDMAIARKAVSRKAAARRKKKTKKKTKR